MVGCIDSRHSNRFFFRAEHTFNAIVLLIRLNHLFCTNADFSHRFDGFNRIFARSRFSRQHHSVSAIEHRIRHIHDFGAGWHRVTDHRFHHLRCGNHHTVEFFRA
ncbi:Uncharacterised protein [Vibrio cholerae]|uniref:Uncharacterized protein n=1 Tax=Vibrio cholerae TaxID=666 RepID=A0A656AJ09_VIBCL|nr:Uncharacterised protein [Vibrio cholerae]CSD12308.1 Uncharacterised protein [Vibrio cholerae]CSI51999.1 Uncharacterised protein [Vibrio cholerae]